MFSSSRRTLGFAAASLSAAALAAGSLAPAAGAAAAAPQCSTACSAVATAIVVAKVPTNVKAGGASKSTTEFGQPTSGSTTGRISICSYSYGC
jgi:hypothetical protein